MNHADKHASPGHHCHPAGADQPTPTKTIDPVCGMTVDPATTAHHAAHAGNDYHFCNAGCRTEFIADPARYLSDAPRAEPAATWPTDATATTAPTARLSIRSIVAADAATLRTP